MVSPPDDVRDEAYRIAKVWGCLCRPTITHWDQDPVGNVLHVRLRHQTGCGYDPIKFFKPPPEIDDDAIAESAAVMKKLRQRNNRKYTTKGTK